MEGDARAFGNIREALNKIRLGVAPRNGFHIHVDFCSEPDDKTRLEVMSGLCELAQFVFTWAGLKVKAHPEKISVTVVYSESGHEQYPFTFYTIRLTTNPWASARLADEVSDQSLAPPAA